MPSSLILSRHFQATVVVFGIRCWTCNLRVACSSPTITFYYCNFFLLKLKQNKRIKIKIVLQTMNSVHEHLYWLSCSRNGPVVLVLAQFYKSIGHAENLLFDQ